MYGWLLSWVWLSDKVHVKGGYAVFHLPNIHDILGICFFPSLFLFFPLFFFILLSLFYLMDVVGGHVSLLLGSSLIKCDCLGVSFGSIN